MSETVPRVSVWERTRVRVAVSTGWDERDGYIIDLAPGLAVVLSDSMQFSVTHIETGLRFGPRSSLALPCCIFVLEWSLICAELEVDVADPRTARAEMGRRKDEPVPFDGFTTRDKDGERRASIRDWLAWNFGVPVFSQYVDIPALDEREQVLSAQLAAVRGAEQDEDGDEYL